MDAEQLPDTCKKPLTGKAGDDGDCCLTSARDGPEPKRDATGATDPSECLPVSKSSPWTKALSLSASRRWRFLEEEDCGPPARPDAFEAKGDNGIEGGMRRGAGRNGLSLRSPCSCSTAASEPKAGPPAGTSRRLGGTSRLCTCQYMVSNRRKSCLFIAAARRRTRWTRS